MEWVSASTCNHKWYQASSPLDSDMFHAWTWCTTNESSGNFTRTIFDNMWYFEYKDDALLFTLKWGA